MIKEQIKKQLDKIDAQIEALKNERDSVVPLRDPDYVAYLERKASRGVVPMDIQAFWRVRAMLEDKEATKHASVSFVKYWRDKTGLSPRA